MLETTIDLMLSGTMFLIEAILEHKLTWLLGSFFKFTNCILMNGELVVEFISQ